MSRTHRKGTRAGKKTHGGARHAILDSGGHNHKKFKHVGGSYSLWEQGKRHSPDAELQRSTTGHSLT